MLNKKEGAIEAFQLSASLCIQLQRRQTASPAAGQSSQHVSALTALSNPVITRRLHALASQIRLCGDPAAALEVDQLASSVENTHSS